MKKSVFISSLLLSSLLVAETQFSDVSTEDLVNMKGSVPAEQRAEFQEEMKSRMSSMTPEQRAEYGVGQKGQGRANGEALRDGSATGSMNQGANSRGAFGGGGSGKGLGRGGGGGGRN